MLGPFKGNDSISTAAFFAMSNTEKTARQGKRALYATLAIYHEHINNKVNIVF